MRGRRDHERIRALSDQMRVDGPESSGSNHWVLTRGVVGLGGDEVRRAIEAVRFDDDNDPYGEHDLGALELAVPSRIVLELGGGAAGGMKLSAHAARSMI